MPLQLKFLWGGKNMTVHNNHIMPGHYKGMLDEINQLIEDGNKALGNPDKNGCVNALIFHDELLDFYGLVANKKGEIKDRIEQLKNNNSRALGKYEKALILLDKLYDDLHLRLKEWNQL